MRKTIIFVLCLVLAFTAAACSGTSSVTSDGGDEVIYPRGEIEAETVEEDNAYEMKDAGKMINCDYWFPVDASQPVTIQILNIDGEDTVMDELTFPVSRED